MAGKAGFDLRKYLDVARASFRVIGRSFDRLVERRPW
jgi:hypothetical protein